MKKRKSSKPRTLKNKSDELYYDIVFNPGGFCQIDYEYTDDLMVEVKRLLTLHYPDHWQEEYNKYVKILKTPTNVKLKMHDKSRLNNLEYALFNVLGHQIIDLHFIKIPQMIISNGQIWGGMPIEISNKFKTKFNEVYPDANAEKRDTYLFVASQISWDCPEDMYPRFIKGFEKDVKYVFDDLIKWGFIEKRKK